MAKKFGPPGLLTYSDVMELLACSRSTVLRMVRKGILAPPHDVEGIGLRFWEDEVYGYLYQQRAKSRAKSDKPSS